MCHSCSSSHFLFLSTIPVNKVTQIHKVIYLLNLILVNAQLDKRASIFFVNPVVSAFLLFIIIPMALLYSLTFCTKVHYWNCVIYVSNIVYILTPNSNSLFLDVPHYKFSVYVKYFQWQYTPLSYFSFHIHQISQFST